MKKLIPLVAVLAALTACKDDKSLPSLVCKGEGITVHTNDLYHAVKQGEYFQFSATDKMGEIFTLVSVNKNSLEGIYSEQSLVNGHIQKYKKVQCEN